MAIQYLAVTTQFLGRLAMGTQDRDEALARYFMESVQAPQLHRDYTMFQLL